MRSSSSRSCLLLVAALAAAGCCARSEPPAWGSIDAQTIGEHGAEYDLVDWVVGGKGALVFDVTSSDSMLIASVDDNTLELQPQPDWLGTATISLTVTDKCERSDVVEVEVTVVEGAAGDSIGSGDEYFVDPCKVTFSYEEQGTPDDVYVTGSFNDWDVTQYPMDRDDAGTWSVAIPKEEIPPGAYAYRFVEITDGSEASACDPNAGLIQCDEGYKEADDTSWTQDCTLNADSCNSMVIVDDFDRPRLTVTSLVLDRPGHRVTAQVRYAAGCSGAEAATAFATLDDEDVQGAFSGDSFDVDIGDLSNGRHTLRFNASDAADRAAEETYIPFWMEEESGWDRGVMYYAFVDRFVDGDASNDSSEGASDDLADYMGGDFQGIIDALPYLEDLGVNIIWVANPQENAEDAWSSDCGTAASYHGYWPDEPLTVEAHFGGEGALEDLIDAAHARGMRVVMDWVGNHVHQDHPYYQAHASDGWFNPKILCKNGDDYSNFDLIPETCWFAGYLPDLRYYELDPLATMVEDAIWWVKTYELDGLRVDGAKHVPHSVVWNLGTRINQEVEHGYVGGDEQFYTVGETFSGSRDVVAAYVNEHELDGQFDFPLFYSIRDTFVATSGFSGLENSMNASRAAYGNALMSTFLGNHDVSRFLTYAEDPGSADSDDNVCLIADVVSDAWWYGRLESTFTYLFTNPGIPLIYYGDEIGIPGYRDPDNRHPLSWYASGLEEGEFDLEAFVAGLDYPEMEAVPTHVAALGQARTAHPAFYSGTETQWWLEDPYWYAYARVIDEDEVLVLMNLHWDPKTFTNGLSFADLSPDGTWEDVLTGETFPFSGDELTISVPGNSSRVLVRL